VDIFQFGLPSSTGLALPASRVAGNTKTRITCTPAASSYKRQRTAIVTCRASATGTKFRSARHSILRWYW
jgi:hypothetical protein